jgi:hypothetical protein
LQWRISSEQLEEMERLVKYLKLKKMSWLVTCSILNFSAFKRFIKFVVECVARDTLDPSIMTLTTHYCLHVSKVVKDCGPLRALSAKSMEVNYIYIRFLEDKVLIFFFYLFRDKLVLQRS